MRLAAAPFVSAADDGTKDAPAKSEKPPPLPLHRVLPRAAQLAGSEGSIGRGHNAGHCLDGSETNQVSWVPANREQRQKRAGTEGWTSNSFQWHKQSTI